MSKIPISKISSYTYEEIGKLTKIKEKKAVKKKVTSRMTWMLQLVDKILKQLTQKYSGIQREVFL